MSKETKEQKEKAAQAKEDEKPTRAGIPKDWISTNMPFTLEVKYCDMKAEMKDYAFLITEYVTGQLIKGQFKYFKDLAEHIKKGFEEEYGGTWHVICGINFGSYFNYESKCCILLYRSSIGFLIWKYG